MRGWFLIMWLLPVLNLGVAVSAGAKPCMECHPKQQAEFQKSAMAIAAITATFLEEWQKKDNLRPAWRVIHPPGRRVSPVLIVMVVAAIPIPGCGVRWSVPAVMMHPARLPCVATAIRQRTVGGMIVSPVMWVERYSIMISRGHHAPGFCGGLPISPSPFDVMQRLTRP